MSNVRLFSAVFWVTTALACKFPVNNLLDETYVFPLVSILKSIKKCLHVHKMAWI